jgi:hypothetical protein
MIHVITYYTKGTPYEEEIKNLIASCDYYGIPHTTKAYTNRGDWVANTRLKPIFIREMLEILPENSIVVYLDADAIVRSYPALLDHCTFDVGIYFQNGVDAMGGTLCFKNTELVRAFVRRWEQTQEYYPEKNDQEVLRGILKQSDRFSLKIGELPPTYCHIFDLPLYYGEPVIEHNQASRRFYQEVAVSSKPIPNVLGKSRVRHLADGSYSILRPDKEAEEYLDKYLERVGPLRWQVRLEKHWEDLAGLFQSKTVYLVGKGPSLDALTEQDFKDPTAVVICINEAIHAIERLDLTNPVVGIQKDQRLRNSCKPSGSPLLVSLDAATWYADYDKAYYFKATPGWISAVEAIKIARGLGAEELILYGFDSALNGSLDYAESVGYESSWGGSPTRFMKHEQMIIDAVGEADLVFATPSSLFESFCDTLPLSSDSPQEHHEPDCGKSHTASPTTQD